MERLTKQSESGMTWFIDHENNGIALEPCEMDSHNNRLAIERLADYENAEEQGLLLKLPCKVGDTVYLIKSDGKVVPRTADMQFLGVLWDYYGKEWFITKEEAEAKLKESEE